MNASRFYLGPVSKPSSYICKKPLSLTIDSIHLDSKLLWVVIPLGRELGKWLVVAGAKKANTRHAKGVESLIKFIHV